MASTLYQPLGICAMVDATLSAPASTSRSATVAPGGWLCEARHHLLRHCCVRFPYRTVPIKKITGAQCIPWPVCVGDAHRGPIRWRCWHVPCARYRPSADLGCLLRSPFPGQITRAVGLPGCCVIAIRRSDGVGNFLLCSEMACRQLDCQSFQSEFRSEVWNVSEFVRFRLVGCPDPCRTAWMPWRE